MTHYYVHYDLRFREGDMEERVCSGAIPFEMVTAPNDLLRIIRRGNTMKFQLPHKDISISCKVGAEPFDEDFFKLSLGSRAKAGQALHSIFRDTGLLVAPQGDQNWADIDAESGRKNRKKKLNETEDQLESEE